MKGVAGLGLALAVLPLSPALPQSKELLNANGNAFLEKCGGGDHPLECSVYVAGFYDGIEITRIMAGNPNCIPKEATWGQMTDVIAAYIRNHPADRHMPTNALGYVALTLAFPCEPTSK